MVALFVWLGETLRILKLCKKKKDICVPSGNENGYIGEWMKGWIGELKKKKKHNSIFDSSTSDLFCLVFCKNSARPQFNSALLGKVDESDYVFGENEFLLKMEL